MNTHREFVDDYPLTFEEAALMLSGLAAVAGSLLALILLL